MNSGNEKKRMCSVHHEREAVAAGTRRASRMTGENRDGEEWMCMECAAALGLRVAWEMLSDRQRAEVLRQRRETEEMVRREEGESW